MISLLFIAAGAATAFWLELYSLGPWFLYISLDGAMWLRWVASPLINVFCYTISYIVHYHYYFHKSISVGSFLLLLGIVPATISISFVWHPKKILEVNLDWVGFYNSWCPSGCVRTEKLAFQAGRTFILIHVLLMYSAKVVERCRWLTVWAQAGNKNMEYVTARYRSGFLFSWLQTGHFTPVSSLVPGRISQPSL